MELKLLATGYGLLEAPRVDQQNRLYFSDALRGGVYRRHPEGWIETLIPKRRGIGGLALNQGGGLVLGGRTIIFWDERGGQSRELFASFEGVPIKGFNDLQPDALGSVLVGTLNFNAMSGEPPVPGSLFRLDPDGAVTKLWEGIEVSNGLGFSPDGKLLYHSDSTTQAVWVYDVKPDRSLADRRIFARVPSGWPDGLAVDSQGGVVVAVFNGGEAMHFRNDGTLDWRCPLLGTQVTSVTFGGPELSDLYIVTADDKQHSGAVYVTRAEVPGLAVPQARFAAG